MKKATSICILPLIAAGMAKGQAEFDAVPEGKKVFESMGCIVCHSTLKDDASPKAGPNLYGVFLAKPRTVETVLAASGEKRMVKANLDYLMKSVRKPTEDLVVAESGPTKGTAYPPIMPAFAPEVIRDQDLESIWHYLRSMADPGKAGPAKVMLKRKNEVAAKSLLEIPGEIPVATRPRVQRAPLVGLSGRAVHVGLPDGMSYSFDPRMLSVRRIWSGGFLNLKEEWTGRAGNPSNLGHGASVLLDKEPVLAPLTSGGEIVDFEFKEPDLGDDATVEKYLWDGVDFRDRLAGLDAKYLGHQLDPATGAPRFRFRVGANVLTESVNLTEDGHLEITLEGKLVEPQRFKLRGSGLGELQVEGGEIRDGVWSLSPTLTSATFHLTALLAGQRGVRMDIGGKETREAQPLVIAPSEPGRKPLEIPSGYSVLTWQPPLDGFGRKQLFEPTGIAVAKDGTIVLATRTAGVWRIRDGKWTQFAEGTFECLGVCIEDDKGDRVVITQKPELTRLIDSDGDGRADIYDTLCDDYGFHGNYHEYTHGPVRDSAGNYYFTLNLAHSPNGKASWRAGGPYLGSMGGYRGWACRLTPDGKFEPYAYGLRSPAGLAFDPDGRLWYAENQGEYVGSSKMVPLEEGKFYGHLSGLVSLPGMKPDCEALNFDHWKDKIRKGAVWIPYGRFANSPGNPAWDVTGGKFGIYQGQMFIGDQTLSTLLRIVTEKVNGMDQGCVMPFAKGLASGVMRPCFLPDGSLLVGQTGRGWGANGGHQDSLQQIVWDGKTVVTDILSVAGSHEGFDVRFTCPLNEKTTGSDLMKGFKVQSWFYTDTSEYGSPEHDSRTDAVKQVEISPDRLTARIKLADFGKGDKWLDRIYHISMSDTEKLLKTPVFRPQMEAYFTLRAIP